MKKLLLLLLIPILGAFTNTKPAYLLYDKEGKKITYEVMLKELLEADVVFFGELHNNPIAHWLQYEMTKDAFAVKEDKLILGAEMFEADNQMILTEYLMNLLKESVFMEDCKLWPNYKTDYRPLVEFAKDNYISFIATNIPRRYASMINHGDFESLNCLTDEARCYIAPLPITYDPELPCYKKMEGMMGGMKPGAPVMHIAKAQAAKDATMAHFISKNLRKDGFFLHFNGAYHSDYHEGIVWYLKKAKPELKIKVITTIELDNIENIPSEQLKKADYILAVPSSMTKTY